MAFPDTANFTDPAYTAMPWDPNYSPGSTGGFNDGGLPDIPNLPSDLPGSAPPLGTQNQGPAAPVSAQPGSSLLGWLNLGSTITQTVVNATRGNPTTQRPGTLATSVTNKSALTLGIIAVIFVAVVFFLRKA